MVELSRAFFVAGAAEQRGDLTLRPVDVGLLLDQRDGRGGERAVCVDDCVARIFPTLVAQSFFRLAGILDITTAVEVAVSRDPIERYGDLDGSGYVEYSGQKIGRAHV